MENRIYKIYFNCPRCPLPDCGKTPQEESYIILKTPGKTEARKLFEKIKACRYMKIIRVERLIFEKSFIKEGGCSKWTFTEQ